MSKLIFHSETRQLPGVHITGEGASELIHIGQAVLSFGGTIDDFIETVFNYPTLAECYKVAAFDGINRLGIFDPDPAEIRQTGIMVAVDNLQRTLSQLALVGEPRRKG